MGTSLTPQDVGGDEEDAVGSGGSPGGNEEDPKGSGGNPGGNKEDPEGRDCNLLLLHAKLHALAQHLNIQALQKMTLERLGTSLALIEQHTLVETSSIVLNFIELLGYVYHNSSCTSPKSTIRDLVSTFAVENMGNLVDRKKMRLLLREGGELAIELMDKVIGRLRDEGQSLSSLKNSKAHWEARWAASDRYVCELEVTISSWRSVQKDLEDRAAISEEKVLDLEAKASSWDSVKKNLEDRAAASEEKVLDLEDTIHLLESLNSEMEEQFKDKIQTFGERGNGSWVLEEEGATRMEVLDTLRDKLKKSKAREKVLEEKLKLLEAVNAGKR